MCIPSIHAVVSTPAELQSAFVADFLCNAGLPRLSDGSASTSIVSRPHRAFTCVTACIFAGSPSDPFHRRLRRIRCLLRRFDCYWASDPSQAGLPPAKIHTHSRRTDILLLSLGDGRGVKARLQTQTLCRRMLPRFVSVGRTTLDALPQCRQFRFALRMVDPIPPLLAPRKRAGMQQPRRFPPSTAAAEDHGQSSARFTRLARKAFRSEAVKKLVLDRSS